MVVMMPRETWTDARLDEFAKRMDERFDRIDERFDRIEADIREIRHRFLVLEGTMITGFLTLAGLIVF
jgi:hypothetical protein